LEHIGKIKMIGRTAIKGAIFSYKQMIEIKEILDSKNEGITEYITSLDLNISSDKILIDHSERIIRLPNNQKFNFPDSFNPEIDICYKIRENQVFPMQLFNDDTGFFYKLVPTSYRPILRISATQMHKKPFLDYIQNNKPKGLILDAGTGLGYSAIIASKTADQVITVEWDEYVLEIASNNPHSYELFESTNIKSIHGDVTEIIKQFPDKYFDNIIQDGGMPKSSGNFFSQEQAFQLYRVIKQAGKLFFYLPKKGKHKGRDFALEQRVRMQNAGFKARVIDTESSFIEFTR
jgi:uncharacterized protein